MMYDIQGRPTPIEWAPTSFPLRYEIDPRLATLTGSIDSAFEAWAAIPDANVRFESAGTATRSVRSNDGHLVISMTDDLFRDQGALALTTYTFDSTGRFTDADIQIDPALLSGNYNVDTALRHEVGHVLGLDHSAVLSSTMYPFVGPRESPTGFDSDDRIAITNIYPKNDRTLHGATLQGRVIGDGGGIFGAQVVAVNARGEPVATGLTDAAGEFTLVGMPAGRYRIYAEPLDGPVDSSALQGTWRQAKVVSFPTQFYEGPPLEVENGRVYGNLIVTAAGAVRLNPRWIGRMNASSGDVSLTITPVCVKGGETVTLAVAGDGFISGMTQFEVLSPDFRRVSDFTWAGNYVSAKFMVEANADTGSAVVMVHNGRDSASLTGALRISKVERASRSRAVRH